MKRYFADLCPVNQGSPIALIALIQHPLRTLTELAGWGINNDLFQIQEAPGFLTHINPCYPLQKNPSHPTDQK